MNNPWETIVNQFTAPIAKKKLKERQPRKPNEFGCPGVTLQGENLYRAAVKHNERMFYLYQGPDLEEAKKLVNAFNADLINKGLKRPQR